MKNARNKMDDLNFSQDGWTELPTHNKTLIYKTVDWSVRKHGIELWGDQPSAPINPFPNSLPKRSPKQFVMYPIKEKPCTPTWIFPTSKTLSFLATIISINYYHPTTTNRLIEQLNSLHISATPRRRLKRLDTSSIDSCHRRMSWIN